MAVPDAPRSPSPAPSAPVADAPGRKATVLADIYSKALAATLRTCSYDNFAACFPTPAVRTPRVLRAVWEQICGKIESKGRAEFEQILKERQVVQSLNGLETVIAEARGRRQASSGEMNAGVPYVDLRLVLGMC